MELLIIRHGQSEADILKVIEGRADFPLTRLGEKQAYLMSNWVKENYPPDYILSSTLKRASQTAKILSEITGIEAKFIPELVEFNNGLLAGLTKEEADAKYPEIKDKKPHESYYGMESLLEFKFRAETTLSMIINEYPADKRIAIISHGKMINMLFRSFLNLPLNCDINIVTSDTGIHLWVIDGNKRIIKFLNSLIHMK